MSLEIDELVGSLNVLKRLNVNSDPGVIFNLLVKSGHSKTLMRGYDALVGVVFVVRSLAIKVHNPFLFSMAIISILREPGLGVSSDSSSSNSVFTF